ncbi:hypothetical protein NL676_002210 [Syzygium grande]|nr:hypothetical protein NL676_002210 [Syzygium grande]
MEDEAQRLVHMNINLAQSKSLPPANRVLTAAACVLGVARVDIRLLERAGHDLHRCPAVSLEVQIAGSVITEWGLNCNRKFIVVVPASLFFLSSLLGSAVYGHLADARLGQKRTVLIACVLTALTSFLTSLSPNVWTFAFLRFANGFARLGIGICCLVLSTEAVGRKWRGQVGQYGFFFFTAGFLSLPLIAYPTRSCWRDLYKIISIFPLLYCFLLVPFVSESPRWLLIKGHDGEALDVLKKFARLNGKKLPSNLVLSNPSPPKTVGKDMGGGGSIAAEPEESLWRTKWAAQRMILVMSAGFELGLVYFGIQLTSRTSTSIFTSPWPSTR